MSIIEPFDGWLHIYDPEEDELSIFYGADAKGSDYMVKVYNNILSPYWDKFGSVTMYCKVLFLDYHEHSVIIELVGEWNDAVENDIMYLKRELIDVLIAQGVCKFILICENVLNFHGSDDSYYQEWNEDIENESGFIILLNAQEHVQREMQQENLNEYVFFLHYEKWRTHLPQHFFNHIENEFFSGLLD